MRKVFKDDKLDAQFKNEGYVILPLLERSRAKELYSTLKELESGVGGRFYASLWSSDKEYRLKVDKIVKGALSPFVEKYLDHYTPFFSDLIVKKPSLKLKVDIHQDWAFVDEEQFSSLFIWCPLQDVNTWNGCLQVVPKSHLYLTKIRGSNIKPAYNAELLKETEKYLKNLIMKAGEAVLYNPALFHASPPNWSFKDRLCIGLTCLPDDAKMYHYHFNLDNMKVEKLEIDYDFIMNFNEKNNFKEGLFTGTLQKPEGGKLISYMDEPKEEIYNASLKKILEVTG